MNLTTFLDVAIGLCLIYLGTSLLVTIANEYIAQVLNLRASQLRKDLKTLIDDPTLVTALSKNPALEPFFRPAGSLLERVQATLSRLFWLTRGVASFVDPNVLAQQMMGSMASLAPDAGRDAATPDAKARQALVAGLGQLGEGSSLKPQLQALVNVGSVQVDKVVQSVGAYLDRTLSAMGEVYKRKLQLISLGVGLCVAVVFNIDTVVLAKRLYRDREAREAVLSLATQFTSEADRTRLDACLKAVDAAERAKGDCKELSGLADALRGRNESLGQLPLGWADATEARRALGLVGSQESAPPGPPPLSRWAGLLLTAVAVSLGASFWFDLLNRFVNVRHAMRKPEAEPTATGGEAKG